MTEDGLDKRREERVLAMLPVTVEGNTGVTRDVSASGMFFETSATFEVGNEIMFSVEFDAPEGKRILKCHGNIVRTVTRGGRVGVAVKILDSTMESSAVVVRASQVAAG